MQKSILLRLLFLFFTIAATAQTPQKSSTSEIFHNLQKLNFVGSALYIAAHPDDENTRLISYLVNDVHANTAYLSLTRGDGGQNLVGPELRELLGVIRTQELLAARRTDGGQQFFTRANDFGYSKNPDETFTFWNRDDVLSDVVRTIRKFKPDVIVNRFDHRSPGSTHGHHTASAMLSVEAFDLVNNASKFPKSAEEYGVWKPQRLFFNTSWWFYGSQEKFEKANKSNLVSVETGNYFPELGLSNGEIASLSRSMHKSQGFGSTGSRGTETEYLELLEGSKPSDNNLFEGINTKWSRLDGGSAIGAILNPLEENFNYKNPSEMLPQLLKAYSLVSNLKDEHWRNIKLKQLDQLILDCGGIFIEAASEANSINPNENFKVNIEAINRGKADVVLKSVKNSDGKILWNEAATLPFNKAEKLEITVNSGTHDPKYSSPYWLNEKGTVGMYVAQEELIGLPETPPLEQLVFELQFENTTIPFTKSIIYKFNDPVKGEVYRPLEVLPEVTASIAEKVLIFASNDAETVSVIVRAGKDTIFGNVSLQHPQGWKVEPAQQAFQLERNGETKTFNFTVTPPSGQSEGYLKAIVSAEGKVFDKELVVIDYEHIPYQSVLLPSEAKVAKIDIQKKGQNIGYINGAGDAIPESLKQIGYIVTTIEPSNISEENLKNFDAIVVGIRAYNTVPELAFVQPILNKYVENGGTMIVQYNTSRGLITENLAPYDLKLSRDRVTDEFSEIKFLAPENPLLNTPNKITQKDFEGWVQERGLYFPDEWAKEFTPILGMKDKGESQTKGSLLVAKYGRGYYIYTGLSFFRELPAGVSGAYRLFANMLSVGK
ncbi:putative LmbE-like protein [Aequorivita sublithincola DSM 14238]|uniref:Putative LmbE-like protein n=1 Tax=Aequorivita sublithincola (strain DSM 14238 / LMG 21431 / ACAM 643 / 9-3) TaxID=746697 RepID=I3YZK3_AEQSU|nr:PIG-L family deacetylase [Aequorivita sublithincola]AFL82421.1 putative LmbE-like protein [Aequorivita sublithincola DSM 14238]